MTILGRYIFRQAFGAVLLILASLTTVIWIAVALRQLEFSTAQGQTIWLFFKLTTLALPGLLGFVAPIAMLIASVHTLNRLNSDSELIVATAGGVSPLRLAWPLLTLALIVSIAVSLVNHVVAPWAGRTLRDTAVQARTDLISQVLQPGRFTALEAKMTVHIRDRAPDGTLLGLLMHDARDEKQTTTYLAERGHIVKQGAAAYLLMQTGHILRRQPGDTAADIVVFKSYAIDINRFEQKAESGMALRPRDRTTVELFNPDPADPIWREQPGRYRAEIHERFANGLYPFAYAFIALAFVGQAATTRQNRTQGLITAIGLGFAARIIGISVASQAVVKDSALPWLYAIPILAGLLAMTMMIAQLRPRPPLRIALARAMGRS
jgi:lipopolysaccharide export system permease protein